MLRVSGQPASSFAERIEDRRLVELVYCFSLHALVALASSMLLLAEARWWPHVLTFPSIVFAIVLWMREINGRPTRQLRVGGAIAVAAMTIVLGLQLYHSASSDWVAAAGSLIVWATWIALLAAHRTAGHLWLLGLTLALVCITALETVSLSFGLLLVVYLFAAVWTLSLRSLLEFDRTYERFFARARSEPAPSGLRAPDDSGPTARLSVEGTIQRDLSERRLNPRFIVFNCVTAALALLICIAVFVLTPRGSLGGRDLEEPQLTSESQPALTGFAAQVKLGDIGRILEDSSPVLEVRLFDTESGLPVSVLEYARRLGCDEPLFRGSAMGRYRDGEWQRSSSFGRAIRVPAGTSQPSIRQEIRQYPTGTNILFAMQPVLAGELIDSDAPVLRGFDDHLIRSRGATETEVQRCAVYSVKPPGTLSAGPELRAIYTVSRGPDLRRRRVIPQWAEIPDHGLERLVELARRIVVPEASDSPPTATLAIERLQAYLERSGEFTYTLDATVVDPSVDPVVDFLFNRKQGHCEYFASALTLMLRSVGVPARVVRGFKGGTINRVTGYFQVEKRHAHTWVEALVDGRWITLDPSPAEARAAIVQSAAVETSLWRTLQGRSAELWSRHVVQMTALRQREQVYEPLGKLAQDTLKRLTPTADKQRSGEPRTLLKKVLPWLGTGLLVVVVLAALWFVPRFRRYLPTRAAGRLTSRKRPDLDVAFYDRFLQICRRNGLARTASETQREFANAIETRFGNALATGDLAGLPDEITASFYKIRFGQAEPDAELTRQLETKLTRFEHALGNGGRREN